MLKRSQTIRPLGLMRAEAPCPNLFKSISGYSESPASFLVRCSPFFPTSSCPFFPFFRLFLLVLLLFPASCPPLAPSSMTSSLCPCTVVSFDYSPSNHYYLYLLYFSLSKQVLFIGNGALFYPLCPPIRVPHKLKFGSLKAK